SALAYAELRQYEDAVVVTFPLTDSFGTGRRTNERTILIRRGPNRRQASGEQRLRARPNGRAVGARPPTTRGVGLGPIPPADAGAGLCLRPPALSAARGCGGSHRGGLCHGRRLDRPVSGRSERADLAD